MIILLENICKREEKSGKKNQVPLLCLMPLHYSNVTYMRIRIDRTPLAYSCYRIILLVVVLDA